MTRYFYRDSLAAAWMAKHFGMKFKTARGQNMYWDGGSDFRTEKDCGVYGGEYHHIHPDSLHLLEPRDGDCVEFDRWHWDRQRHEDFKDALPQPHFGLVRIDDKWKRIFSVGHGWDMVRLGEQFSLPHKIIQRNGLPYFWPESEAA